jgi:2-methylcitrate dehydratase PrpD
MKWANTVPSTMTKYLSAGWISEAEVTATLLAELGYTGDKEVLNGELGFWRFYASDKWAPQAVTKRLGEDWRILRVSYKAYPCCAAMHSALNCFYKIIDENNLEPQDIEHVDVLLDPLSALPLWRNMEVETHIEAQFSVAYVFAVAAHRVRIGAEWQDSNTIKDARILEFMKKVSFAPHPDYGKAVLETATSNLAMVEVIARGRTFREEKAYFEGAAFPETARLKDEELIEKFEHNAATILTQDKIAKAVSSIWELEEIADVSELLKLVSL